MAKRRKRKFNPTGLEAGLMTGGALIIGSIGGFVLASWGCAKLLQGAVDTGQLSDPRSQ